MNFCYGCYLKVRRKKKSPNHISTVGAKIPSTIVQISEKRKEKKVSFEMEKDPEKVVKEVPKVYFPTLGLWFESGLSWAWAHQ